MKAKFVLLCLFLISCSNLRGQENHFIGGWELTGIPSDAGLSFHKYFNEKGEFYNTRIIGDQVLRTHHGKYVIKSTSEYWEFIAKDTYDFMAQAAGKTAYIFYKFSDDKQLLTLKADPVPGNSGWQETWKRIKVKTLAGKVRPIKQGVPAR